MHVLGIDIGGSLIKGSLVDSSGTLKGKREINICELREEGTFLKSLIAWIQEFEDQSQVLGVGLGVPGFVSPDQNSLIEIPNVPEINGEELIARLKDLYPNMPILVANDANTAALGAYQFSPDIQRDTFAFLTWGTGLGSSLIVQGKLFTGALGNGPELGMLPLFEGKTVEEVVGKAGILNLSREIAQAYEASEYLDHPQLSTKFLYEKALAHEPVALETLAQIGQYMGKALSVFIQITDIPEIYVGGGIAPCFPFMEKTMIEEIQQRLLPYYLEELSVQTITLGNDSGIIGAAALVYNTLNV